jgi:hypothetical protein
MRRATPWPLIAFRSVGLPKERLEVLECIRATIRGWLNVVNFPAILRFGVTVFRILHRVATNIASPNRFVVSVNRRSLLPYS